MVESTWQVASATEPRLRRALGYHGGPNRPLRITFLVLETVHKALLDSDLHTRASNVKENHSTLQKVFESQQMK